ncbi:MAG: hydantoinase B/oxoprolinase family protein [Nitrososphaerales archaeon]
MNAKAMDAVQQKNKTIDSVTLQVIWNNLVTTADEMSINLQRSAYSSNIKTRRDHSCAIFDSSSRTLAQAHDQPAHLGLLSMSVPLALKDYGSDNIEEGDMIALNDPYHGSAHLPDITIISPAYYKGKLSGYVVNLAHHQDVGGMTPGSVPGNATEIWQEGLIIPVIKIVRKGELIGDMLKFILANVRGSRDRLGDYRAQIAANKYGAIRLSNMFDKYGEEIAKLYIEAILDYTERAVRREIQAKLPEGSYKAFDYLDNDGVEDRPIKIGVEIIVKNGSISFDFSSSDKQTKGVINSTLPCVTSACAFIVKSLTDPDLPINDGFYRAIKIIAPEGSVVNAKRPAAVGGTWEVIQRCVDAMIKALSEVVPERLSAAGKGIICNITFGGINPRTGSNYAFYETQAGGFGGRLGRDGPDAVQYAIHNTENTPVEELESTLPIRILKYELVKESEGPGKFRGGFGVRKDYKFLDHEATFSLLSDRAKSQPWGLVGGKSAKSARYILNPESQDEQILSSKVVLHLKKDEIVSIQTPGGGGYGNPNERDPDLVLRDYQDGLISQQRALKEYSVDIDSTRLTTNKFLGSGASDTGKEME